MINKFCKKPLEECTIALANVAMGKEPADMVIINAKLINVCTKEIIENTQVAVKMGRIALVGDAKHCIGKGTKVIDCEGRYLAPTFLDGHMHVESSMLTVGEYAKAVIPHGTSGIYFDPHEICNVLGLDGVKYMLEDAKRTPLKAMLTVPSCVPAVPGFEDTGASINAEDIKEAMRWDETVGLGEMTNFPGVINGSPETHSELKETYKADKVVTGHYSMPETGSGLNAYIASGARCCHESVRAEDVLYKMRLGMYAQLREGSAWHDLKNLAPVIVKNKNLDTRFACLVTDDSHPHTLKKKGHLDFVVRRAIEEGIDPITAIQMVTINTAECFRMSNEIGSIAPSKCADMVIISDLNKCVVDEVIIDGEVVAKDNKLIKEFELYSYPEKAKHTVHLDKINIEDLKIPAKDGKRKVHVIGFNAGSTITTDNVVEMTAKDGELKVDGNQDIMKAVVFERHHNTGTVGKGFVKGFGIKNGALAQTVAHDAHNLIVIGTNDEDMAIAANALIKCGGGAVTVQNGKILGLVELEVAGLMSEKSLDEQDKLVSNLQQSWKELGCTFPSPFMTMSLLPLACIPDIRLTNRGLVDIRTFKFTDLIEE
ncbi:MAG: adenine deaminase [Firmicutes bacterium]|nr:adenine deaminase [Candidatus Caballimonas caccae]